MQLVLNELSKEWKDIRVIVTADKRGDYIEHMIKEFGGSAIRLPDGLKMRPFFQQLREESRRDDHAILATSLDGPVGPLHEPKKLLFLLAMEADKEIFYTHFTYSYAIRLHRRWDHYAIPLPFTKITATIENLGKVSRDDLKNFDTYVKQLIF